MFEGTTEFVSDYDNIARHRFPLIGEQSTPSLTLLPFDNRYQRNEFADETVKKKPATDPAFHRLRDKVREAFQYASHAYTGLDKTQLQRAYAEALRLADSGIFEAEITPDISIDIYGEFIFSHRSEAGYVDIGVRGEYELSYHVRNDIEPEKTAYADLDWTSGGIPEELYAALAELRKNLVSSDNQVV